MLKSAERAFKFMDDLPKEVNSLASSESVKTEDLALLLKENLEMSKEIRAMVRHINNYVAWQRIFGWIKVLLIVIPLIIGILYLPPFLKGLLSQYESLIGGGLGT